jgi:hypothetical protein
LIILTAMKIEPAKSSTPTDDHIHVRVTERASGDVCDTERKYNIVKKV